MLDPRPLRIGNVEGSESAISAVLMLGMAMAAPGVGATAQRAARVRAVKEEMNIIVYGCLIKESGQSAEEEGREGEQGTEGSNGMEHDRNECH